jgi:hypothetical protein
MSVISGVPNHRLKFILCILGLIAAMAVLLSMKPIETGQPHLSPLVQLSH